MANIYPQGPFVVLYQASYLMQLAAMRPLHSFLLPRSWDVTNYWVQNMTFKRTSDPFCQPNLASRESSLQSIALLLSPTHIRTAFSPLLNIFKWTGLENMHAYPLYICPLSTNMYIVAYSVDSSALYLRNDACISLRFPYLHEIVSQYQYVLKEKKKIKLNSNINHSANTPTLFIAIHMLPVIQINIES